MDQMHTRSKTVELQVPTFRSILIIHLPVGSTTLGCHEQIRAYTERLIFLEGKTISIFEPCFRIRLKAFSYQAIHEFGFAMRLRRNRRFADRVAIAGRLERKVRICNGWRCFLHCGHQFGFPSGLLFIC